jgi:hypothetical protein
MDKKSQFQDGFAPLTVVAGFPRIRSLTMDMSLIVSALRDSDKVELSTDSLKVCVYNLVVKTTRKF